MQTLNLLPAYGRNYRSKAAVLKDWQDGKDFTLYGTYCSIRDKASFQQRGYTHVEFYSKEGRFLTIQPL